VKFWLRWLANGIAIFLALYLVDSLLHERFHFAKTWPAVLAAVILGFGDSFIRPLHRGKSRPLRAAVTTVLTVLVNVLILQLFVWVGADVSTLGFLNVLLAAAFVTLISGLINWQVGFGHKEKPRPSIRERPERRPGEERRRPARS
jgi:uncharacterized membrane protein YvlD (DUF360 family)